MLKEARISITTIRNNVFLYAIICSVSYIILLLVCKYLNLLHITGLRMLNFLLLTFILIYDVKNLVKKNNGYIPFLQVFSNALFTGALSFLLFAGFVFFYTWFDPYMNALYLNVYQSSRLVPALLIFFEGTGGSVIIAFIVMKYASRFADGEERVKV